MNKETTFTVAETRPAMVCPSWCELPADHPWTDEQTEFTRCHRGPDYRFVWLGDHESSLMPGQVAPGAMLEQFDDLTVDDLRRLAREASLAADWMEANR